MRIGRPDPSLTGVAGLVMFGMFLRRLGVDQELREVFEKLKSAASVYPMAAQLRLLDLFIVGEHRIFGLESMAADALFVRLAGGVVPSLDTAYRDLSRFDSTMIARLERMMMEHGLADVRGRLKSAKVVHLDIDTTVEPLLEKSKAPSRDRIRSTMAGRAITLSWRASPRPIRASARCSAPGTPGLEARKCHSSNAGSTDCVASSVPLR
jgi:hypothetical protein